MKPWRPLQPGDRVALLPSHPAYLQGYRMGRADAETTIAALKELSIWCDDAWRPTNPAFRYSGDLGIPHCLGHGVAEDAPVRGVTLDALTPDGPPAYVLVLPDDVELRPETPEPEDN